MPGGPDETGGGSGVMGMADGMGLAMMALAAAEAATDDTLEDRPSRELR